MTFNANLPRTNSTPPVTPHKLGGVANDLSFEGGGRKKRWRLGNQNYFPIVKENCFYWTWSLFHQITFAHDFLVEMLLSGIRSDSTPCNIMNEVFKAMKRCGFEWKIINPFLVIARMPFDKEAPLRQVRLSAVFQLLKYKFKFRSWWIWTEGQRL